ncbi:MAG: response regulator [Stigonema ocellatum SAG 48.90 = DSM 106950]|nr:response regulator [Stigonema ocellatum SAG 48.90 = DSM 106950]
MTTDVKVTVPDDIFAAGGKMGALMRSIDWSKTSLGSESNWSQSLRTSVSICLSSRFPILICWGAELVMLYNDAYRPILGATKHPGAMGQRGEECWSEIWHIVGPMLESVLTTGIATWSEDQLLLLDRNGYLEECYFTFSYSPIMDETGGIGGIFTAVTETTKRVLGERRLHTLGKLAATTAKARTIEEACLLSAATLAENSHDIPFSVFYVLDETREQASLKATTGTNAATLLTNEQMSLIQPTEFEHVIQTGEVLFIENLTVLSDLPSSVLVLPITQANQEHPVGLVVVGVSPRRKLDDDYQSFFELIVGHVATAIANARAYEEERKRAEALAELDSAKTTFFSNVSHEFRTPLTLLLSPLEDVLTHRLHLLPPEDQEPLQMAHRNGLRLLKLVNTLLDFSRIEAGRVQAVYEPTDLAMLTTELAGMFRSAIERAGMELVVDCPPLPEPVYVDRNMWEKIVLNLLSNAFKFTFEGEIAVSLRWACDHIELAVRDTGTGIPAHELPKIFQRFHRVQGARGRSHEGSGIGLSLVQELIKLHGGTVEVNCVVDKGTCFTVSIPTGYAHLPSHGIGTTSTLESTAVGATAYVEEALRWLPEEGGGEGGSGGVGDEGVMGVMSSSPSCSSPSPHPPLPPSSPARILLADDNADMRDYVQRLLSQQYQVETVTNGIAALAAVRQQLPDVLLTDIMMPGLDGFEMLRSLRADPQTKDLPIILLSACAGEEARIEGLKAGADDYLIKPFSARELLVRVEANLKMARLRQETVRREQELRAKAESAYNQISQILESMTDGFVALDRNWRITYQNQASERINGKPRAEVIGKTHWEEWPASAGSNVEYQYRKAIAEQVPVHFEHYYYSPPAYDMWLEIHVYPGPDGLGVFYRDITKRKQAEVALRQSEARFKRLAANVPGVIYQYVRHPDGSDAFTYVSPKCRELYELEPFELQQDFGLVWAMVHPDDVERVHQANVISAQCLEIFDVEFRLITPSGRLKWLHAKSQPERQANGDVIWDGLVVDITDRKRVEETLRDALQKLNFHVENTPLAVIEWDSEFRVSRWSPEAKRIFGWQEQEVIGKTLNDWQFVFEEDLEAVSSVCTDLMQGNVQRNVNHNRNYRKDGSVVHCEWYNSTLLDESGKLVSILSLALDVSDRIRLQAERDRVLQLEQAARAEAEAANRVKDEFLAVLSHELRSPLNPIVGWSTILRSRKLDEKKTAHALEIIEQSAKVQAQLIDDLLDISRILRGKLSLNISPVNLVSTIEAAMETVHLAAIAKSIEIHTMLEPDVGQVSGDEGRLQQVIWNLLSNAIKFTPETGRVDIRLERVGSQAQITVSDTGKGIHPDFLPHVFEYFRQADATTTRTFGGLGLGLAIVRQLVELHSGTVQVASPGVGQGATFTVRLPLMLTQPNTHQHRIQSEQSLDLNGVKVLVVDDEQNTREFVAFLLELHGASVTSVASADEAFAALTQSKPDVLLSDIGMPNVDGYMFMRQVRTLPPHQGGQIPAIALTAYAGEINHQQALSAGFQKHISKPVEPDTLVAAIASLNQVKKIKN